MTSALNIDIDGNIFLPKTSADIVVIAHGVNVEGVMGAGFAAQIAARYPQVRAEYIAACRNRLLTVGHTQITHVGGCLYVANVASQSRPGRYARAEWLADGLRDMYTNMRVADHISFDVRLPLIGAGIGGMDPSTSLNTITSEALRNAHPGIETTLYLRSGDAMYTRLMTELRREVDDDRPPRHVPTDIR